MVGSRKSWICWEDQLSHQCTSAWIFLRKHKGNIFYYGTRQLWHTWECPKEEVLLSKRVSLAVKTLRTKALEKGVLDQGTEKSIDGR